MRAGAARSTAHVRLLRSRLAQYLRGDPVPVGARGGGNRGTDGELPAGDAALSRGAAAASAA